MSFTEAVSSCFSNYANFNGRARRSEYWYFTLFSILVNVAITVIGTMLGERIQAVLSGIFSLAVLLPSLAVTWRRFHDIGKSGAFYLIGLIPLVGTILVLVWTCTDSMPGDNQYGPNPKEKPSYY